MPLLKDKLFNIKEFNSLKIDIFCSEIIRLKKIESLINLSLRLIDKKIIIGEGTNIIIDAPKDNPVKFPVIFNQILGKKILSKNENEIVVRCNAGENWNNFVNWTLNKQIGGLENLILIPGSVGGAPIQNIGAYGVEVSKYIKSVQAWDFRKNKIVVLQNKECEFNYRSSIFKKYKNENDLLNPRFLIISVDFLLKSIEKSKLNFNYAGIRENLCGEPTPKKIAKIISELRLKKLPDLSKEPNVGSFFINPSIEKKQAKELKTLFPEMPQIKNIKNSKIKVSAAWLIEKSGFKGVRKKNVGVSSRHSLVLVNYKNATAKEILLFAKEIQLSVQSKFKIVLNIEPLIIKPSEK